MSNDCYTRGEQVLMWIDGHRTRQFVKPVDITQDGIGAGCGMSRAHVAIEVKQLKSNHLVEHELCHVKNKPTKVLTYKVTPMGHMRAKSLREANLAQPHQRDTVALENKNRIDKLEERIAFLEKRIQAAEA